MFSQHICYGHLASVRFEHSLLRGSLLYMYIYIYILYIYIYIYYITILKDYMLYYNNINNIYNIYTYVCVFVCVSG